MKDQRRQFLKHCALALNGGLVGAGVSLTKAAESRPLNTALTLTDSDKRLEDTVYQRSKDASRRSLQSRLAEIVTKGDYSNPVDRVKASFGQPLNYRLPPKTVFSVFGSNADFKDLNDAFDAIRGWSISSDTPLTLVIQKGIHRASKTAVHDSIQQGLSIIGTSTEVVLQSTVSCVQKTYTASVKDNWFIGQTFPYYHVTFQLQSVAGLSIGEFILIRSGADDAQNIHNYGAYGAHEIVAIDRNSQQVTVLSLNRLPVPTGFPSRSLTVRVVQSVIRYDGGNSLNQGYSGIRLNPGSVIGRIDKVAIIGQAFPVRQGNRGPYAYQEAVNFYGILAYNHTQLRCGPETVVSGWCAANVFIAGTCDFYGFASNSWGHNIVVGSGGISQMNDCVSHGGFLDGVCVQDGGVISGNRLYMIGNARNGITFSQGANSAVVNGVRSVGNGVKLTANAQGGIKARMGNMAGIAVIVGGRATLRSAVSALNQGYGIRVTQSRTNVRMSTVFGNLGQGLYASENAVVFADQSRFYDNARESGGRAAVDILADNGAQILIGNRINEGLKQKPRLSPPLNTFGTTNGYISGRLSNTADAGIGFGGGTSMNPVHTLRIYPDKQVLIDKNTVTAFSGLYGGQPSLQCGHGISASDVVPNDDNTGHLGSASKRWKDIWAANSTIHTSDWRLKDNIQPCPLGLEFINRLTPVQFKWHDYTCVTPEYEEQVIQDPSDGEYYLQQTHVADRETKHTFSRPHYGLIAQQLKEAYQACGVSDFAGFIQDKETDMTGIRYDELIPVLIRAVQELSDRVEYLEKENARLSGSAYKIPQWKSNPLPQYDLKKQDTIRQPVTETKVHLENYMPPDMPEDNTEDNEYAV